MSVDQGEFASFCMNDFMVTSPRLQASTKRFAHHGCMYYAGLHRSALVLFFPHDGGNFGF